MITFQNIGYLGRLGNQMFQFASTLGIARRKGYDARFPIENCRVSVHSGPIDVKTGERTHVKCDLLDCFDIPEEYFIPTSRLQIHFTYNESKFDYNEASERIPDGANLNGYFQTEKYFLDLRKEIKEIFSFKSHLADLGNRYLEEIGKEKDLISLHIRRGDYTLYPDHHPTCKPEYYTKAIEEIKKISGEDVQIVIFSDDKEWCLENMGKYIGDDFIIPDPKSPYVELYMMTKCDYHVIANSSFSWWGSWLSDSKLTIYPSVWLGPAIGGNTKDVCPVDWINI